MTSFIPVNSKNLKKNVFSGDVHNFIVDDIIDDMPEELKPVGIKYNNDIHYQIKQQISSIDQQISDLKQKKREIKRNYPKKQKDYLKELNIQYNFIVSKVKEFVIFNNIKPKKSIIIPEKISEDYNLYFSGIMNPFKVAMEMFILMMKHKNWDVEVLQLNSHTYKIIIYP